MNFIITRFIRMLERDFNMVVTLDKSSEDKTYNVIIKKIDPLLRLYLLRLHYHPVTGINNIKNEHGNIIKTEIIRTKSRICLPYSKSGLIIFFDDDNYGEFINILDYHIRRFYETHSQIDAINKRS